MTVPDFSCLSLCQSVIQDSRGMDIIVDFTQKLEKWKERTDRMTDFAV